MVFTREQFDSLTQETGLLLRKNLQIPRLKKQSPQKPAREGKTAAPRNHPAQCGPVIDKLMNLAGERMELYFRKDNNGWIISDKVKNLITFKQFNLKAHHFEMLEHQAAINYRLKR